MRLELTPRMKRVGFRVLAFVFGFWAVGGPLDFFLRSCGPRPNRGWTVGEAISFLFEAAIIAFIVYLCILGTRWAWKKSKEETLPPEEPDE